MPLGQRFCAEDQRLGAARLPEQLRALPCWIARQATGTAAKQRASTTPAPTGRWASDLMAIDEKGICSRLPLFLDGTHAPKLAGGGDKSPLAKPAGVCPTGSNEERRGPTSAGSPSIQPEGSGRGSGGWTASACHGVRDGRRFGCDRPQNLLGQREIILRSIGTRCVVEDAFSKAGSFG